MKPDKILIIADMDGCSNIWRRLQTFQGTNSWKESRYDYLDDVNAIIDALEITLDNPIIFLVDIHEESYNFPKEPSGRKLAYLPGIRFGEVPFFSKFPPVNGAIFIGFHVGPGEKGFAGYIFKPKFKQVLVNGEKWGELEYFSQLMGIKKVPIYFVSGTEEVVQKAEKRLPGITTMAVSKDPEDYKGNVATKRYVFKVWDNYRSKIRKAMETEGVIPSVIEKGEVEIVFKDAYSAWCIKGHECSKEKHKVTYKFNSPLQLLEIIFIHAYFDRKVMTLLPKAKLTYQNFIRNLKSRGIIKGF